MNPISAPSRKSSWRKPSGKNASNAVAVSKSFSVMPRESGNPSRLIDDRGDALERRRKLGEQLERPLAIGDCKPLARCGPDQGEAVRACPSQFHWNVQRRDRLNLRRDIACLARPG